MRRRREPGEGVGLPPQLVHHPFDVRLMLQPQDAISQGERAVSTEPLAREIHELRYEAFP